MDKATLDKAQTAVIRARIHLFQHHPFWAHLVMKLPLEWMDEVEQGLSSTNGRSMFIQPEAFLRLTKAQQVTDLVHEAWHCAAGHLTRRGSRDPQKWNIAADIALDVVMAAEGFDMSGPWEQSRVKGLAKMGLSHDRFAGMTAEEVYPLLPDSPKGGCGGNGGKSAGGCCFTPPPPGHQSELEAEWRQAVIEAGQLAGSKPGAWQELVKAAMPKPPFHLKLFEYLQRGMGGDTSWDVLNRRYLWQGLYLPSDTKLVMGEIAVAVDTSGSMSSAQLMEAFGYIRAFREQHPCRLHLIQCDYDVPEGVGYKVYDEYEVLPEIFEVYGRGGTSFDPPFKQLREKRIEPKVLIYLTDGYGEVSEEKRPLYPTLWVIVGNRDEFEAPFGEVVYGNS